MFSMGVAGLMGIGVQELLLITVIVVVVFGAGKLPQIGQGLGQMITNFRKSVKGDQPTQPTVQAEPPKDAGKLPNA
jgi:sec-independent protein translocase protein TatA